MDPATIDEVVAPAAAPADTAPESTDEGVQWGSLAEEFEQGDDNDVEGDLEVVSPADDLGAPPGIESVPASETAPTQGATPAAARPAPAATPAALPVATPAPVPSSASPTVQTPPQGAPASPEPQAPSPDYAKWRGDQLTSLMGQYQLSEDDASAMITEPEVVLPKIAAELHMRVMENAMSAVQKLLPSMLQSYQQGVDVEQRARSLFASINSDLTDPQYESAIIQFGQTYRAVNRNATPEEASRAIGNLVRAAYGLQAPGQSPAGQVLPSTAQAPARPAAATPFVPVRGGGGQALPAGGNLNQFEQFAIDIMNEDD